MPEGFSWAALKSSKSPRTNDPFRVPQMLFQRRAAWGVARVNLWHKKLEIRWIRSSWSAAQRSSASPPATHCASVLISRCSVQVQVCSVATKNLHARRIPTIDCLGCNLHSLLLQVPSCESLRPSGGRVLDVFVAFTKANDLPGSWIYPNMLFAACLSVLVTGFLKPSNKFSFHI